MVAIFIYDRNFAISCDDLMIILWFFENRALAVLSEKPGNITFRRSIYASEETRVYVAWSQRDMESI